MRRLLPVSALTLALGACGVPAPHTQAPSANHAEADRSARLVACEAHRQLTLASLTADDRARMELGRAAGRVAALTPAAAHVEAQTAGGYVLRSTLATVFAGLAFAVLGVLLTAALVVRFGRPKGRLGMPGRPRHEVLARRLAEAIAVLRGTPSAASVMGALAAHFEDVLALAAKRGEALAARGRTLAAAEVQTSGAIAPLAEQAELEDRLEGLVGTVERLHVELLAWRDRADPDAALREVVTRRLATLRESLDASPAAPREAAP